QRSSRVSNQRRKTVRLTTVVTSTDHDITNDKAGGSTGANGEGTCTLVDAGNKDVLRLGRSTVGGKNIDTHVHIQPLNVLVTRANVNRSSTRRCNRSNSSKNTQTVTPQDTVSVLLNVVLKATHFVRNGRSERLIVLTHKVNNLTRKADSSVT